MSRSRGRLLTLVMAGAGASALLAGPAAAAPTLSVTMKSARVNVGADTVTLPLYRGTAAGKPVYYVISDSSSQADAARRGVNWAPRLVRSLSTRAVQRARTVGGALSFPGGVNFAPAGAVVPGPQGFPPTRAVPGAVGDSRYSSLVTTGDGVVLNAPQVANATGQSQSVVSISPDKKHVTLRLLDGFFAGRKVLYLRTDASVQVVAALEESTYAPNLNAVPGEGSDAQSSGRSAIIPVVNGARGKTNRNRQGLQSAVLGEGPPLNVTQSFPNTPDYSPIWDVTPVQWTSPAIAAGKRHLLTSSSAVAAAARAGALTSFGTGPANASVGGIRALGGISNCTTVAILS